MLPARAIVSGVMLLSAAGVGRCSGPVAGSGGGVAAQRPPLIATQRKGVPFRATQVIVRRGPNGMVETRGQVARNSAGSMYVELIDETTKEPAELLIFDVPNHRELVLDVRSGRYRTLALPGLESREVPVERIAEELRAAASAKSVSVHRVKDGMDWTWTRLGVKRLAGLESVGSVEVQRPISAAGESADGPAATDESWISVDLGVAVQRTRHDPLTDEDTQVAMTEIVRSEPDARLFQVPSGYVLDDGEARLVGVASRR